MSEYDSLQTYDPNYTEEHTDSSDFEKTPPDITKLKKKKLFLNKGLLRKVRMREKDIYPKNHGIYEDYGNKVGYENKHQRKEINITATDRRYRDNIIESSNRERLDKPYQKKYVRNELSTSELELQNKVIPRLSNIFRRSNYNDKHKTVVEDVEVNSPRNDKRDYACQVYSVYCDNYTRKLRKIRNTDTPVHELKRQNETPYNSTKVVNYSEPRVNRNAQKEYYKKNSTYAVLPITYSSQSSELDVVTLDSKDDQEYIQLQNQYKKNILRRKVDKQTKISYIYPKNREYQIFSASENENKDVATWYNGKSKEDITRARSSVFWEYMMNKIQQRCGHQRSACSKPCHCADTVCDAKKDRPCCQSKIMCTESQPIPKSTKKAQCQCPPSDEDIHKLNQYNDYVDQDVGTPEPDRKPCQQDHDLVTKTLAQKYNGEILCIHNPPCVLINGCLNVPQRDTTTPTWYVTQEKHQSFIQNENSTFRKSDESHSKYIDIMQYYKEEDRIEKEMQSVCHHNPPCKYVRQCCKPKYPPKLDCCCVHVPMCRKVPECIIESEDWCGYNPCKHKPKCPELPLCAKDWLMYGGVSNVQSEVKRSSDMICQHRPPCINIPKCLGRMMCEGYIPFDAIPDCSHDPPCDKIPACFRKPPKMVPASSQYPAPCRIV